MKKFFILGILLCTSLANIFASGDCSRYYATTHTPGYGGTVIATQVDDCVWTITATPLLGYTFTEWSDDASLSAARTITINPEEDNITYTANFERIPCTHTASATAYAGGSVTTEVINDCSCQYRLTATPSTGWVFIGWDEDGNGTVDGNTDNPRDVYPFEANLTYYAVFADAKCVLYEATYNNPAIGGTVDAVPRYGNCNWVITATPTEGYSFLKWNDGNIENPRMVEIDTDNETSLSYTATFITSDAAIDGWTADSKMVVRTKSVNLGTSTATIYANGTQRATGLALTKTDEGYWSIPASLNTYAGQPLKIIFYCDGDPVSAIDSIVPYVVSANTNISTISANTDVEVVSGTLTMDAASKTIATLNIYPDAKAVVPSEKSLTVNAIYMRANAMDNKYPQLVANGSITNASDTIYYDYALDYSNYYPLAVPYDVLCSNIRTSTGRAASFEIQQYDGALRASSGNGWQVLNDQASGARLNAGQGYVVFAVPYKWNGTRQQRVTVRFPMVANLSTGEAEKSTPVSLYNGEVPADRNWNFLGNPYLAEYTTSADNLIYEDNGVRYITTTSDYYRTFTQSRADENIVIKPFNTFFVQSADDGDLTFTLSQRAQSAPHRIGATPKEIAYGVVLRAADSADRTGLLYGEAFTDAYEMNADLVKWSGEASAMELYSLSGNEKRAYNALPAEDIMRPVPLGFCNAPVGEMTIAFDSEHYDDEPLSAVMLTDHQTGQVVNLLEGSYRFTTDRAQDDTRFAIHALRAPSTTTAVESISTTAVRPDGIYDVLGRRLSGDRLPQGVYIIVEKGQSRKGVIR